MLLFVGAYQLSTFVTDAAQFDKLSWLALGFHNTTLTRVEETSPMFASQEGATSANPIETIKHSGQLNHHAPPKRRSQKLFE